LGSRFSATIASVVISGLAIDAAACVPHDLGRIDNVG